MFYHHAYCPFPNLRGIPICFAHSPILSRVGVSGKPGAVHFAEALHAGRVITVAMAVDEVGDGLVSEFAHLSLEPGCRVCVDRIRDDHASARDNDQGHMKPVRESIDVTRDISEFSLRRCARVVPATTNPAAASISNLIMTTYPILSRTLVRIRRTLLANGPTSTALLASCHVNGASGFVVRVRVRERHHMGRDRGENSF
jgi:hypothetical protein